MNQKVTIVLVNYNDQDYMEDFFDSVSKQDYQNIDVVLVDNASTDSSVEWLKKNASMVHIIELEENVGFGEGCNIGMKYALQQGATYILLLNIDTAFGENLVRELVKYADEKTVTTALTYCGQCEDEYRLWYAGGEIDRKSANVNQLLYENGFEDIFDVEFISGCCMLLHRDVIERIGFFDNLYFLYYEDADLCVRCKKARVDMRCITTTSLWHKVGASSSGGDEKSCSTQYYVTRNRLLFAEKYPELFVAGNLPILRKIYKERAFFDGEQNEKYRLYIQAAIDDYLKGHYEKGYYGKVLLQDNYYVSEGFYDREEDKEHFWYWANSYNSKIYIVNGKKKSTIYNIALNLSIPSEVQGCVTLKVDGERIGVYETQSQISFSTYMQGEQIKCLDFSFAGQMIKNISEENERRLCFQIQDLLIEESRECYYWSPQFFEEERINDDFWRWSSKSEGSIYFVNNTNCIKAQWVEYGVIPHCDKGKLESHKVFLEIKPDAVRELQVKTKFPVLKENNREMSFRVQNLKMTEISDDLVLGTSFYNQETDGENSWNWSSAREGYFYVINKTDNRTIRKLSFEIEPYGGDADEGYLVFQDGTEIDRGVIGKRKECIVEIEPQSVSKITIQTSCDIVSVEERELCFCLRNVCMEDVEEDICFAETFFSQETDGKNYWNWSSSNNADVLVVNGRAEVFLKKLLFEVMPYNIEDTSEYLVIQDGIEIARGTIGRIQECIIRVEPQHSSLISIRTDYEVAVINGVSLCFSLRNVCFEELHKSIHFGQMFNSQETDGENKWSWTSEKNGEFCVVNGEENATLEKLSFEVMPYDIEDNAEYQVFQDGIEIAKGKIGEKQECIIQIEEKHVSTISIQTEYKSTIVEGTPLCFNLRNVVLETVREQLFLGQSFYPQENDGVNNWNWSSEQVGDLYVANGTERAILKKVFFDVVPYDTNDLVGYVVYQDGVELAKGDLGVFQECLIPVEPLQISRISIKTNYNVTNIGGRDLCFNLRNVSLTDVNEYVKFDEAFYAQENDGVSTWRWGHEEQGYISFADSRCSEINIEFMICGLGSLSEEHYDIVLDGELIGRYQFNKVVHFKVDNTMVKLHSIGVLTNLSPQQICGDDRNFTFRVVNFKMKGIER